ncbi:MAG: 16S rRNA (cytosine(1402)-N(4))-methyltransferase [Myxococcales bacterium]|nr:16S rRNA (cytosine(1402)-N(4))-methyltransferase [Myxococcales bacterium]
MANLSSNHIPVLFHEVLEHAQVQSGDVWVDCTLGRGGHTEALLQQGAQVIAFDRDQQAINETSTRLNSFIKSGHLTIIHNNFSEIAHSLESLGIKSVSGILADLGVSSPQLDEAERGFSFMSSGPIDMRMDQSYGISALEWITSHTTGDLCHILRTYGEEARAKYLAKVIKVWTDEAVENETINSLDTLALSRLVESATPMKLRRKLNKHPATRVFQALRIAVNDELGALEQLLKDAPNLLALHGKLLLISFHSLEDRMVKKCFKYLSEPPTPPRRGLPPPPSAPLEFKVNIRKGLIANEEEKAMNPRSRSARLRILTRIRNPHS